MFLETKSECANTRSNTQATTDP